jgi:MFS family permease
MPEASRQDAKVISTFREAPPAAKAILIGMLINRLGTFLNIFLVLFMTHRGFTAVQAGVALGVYGFGGVAGILVGTALADWLGARRATVLSMGGGAVLMIGILYLHNFWALLVDVAVVGMISLLYRPASASLLSELTPKNRQVMIFAVYRLCTNLGTTLSPLVGALLILISYNLLFWGDAITSMGYAVIALLLLPRRADQQGGATARRRRISDLGVVLSDRRYALFLIALFINSAVYIQYVSSLPLAMAAAHEATAWYAFVLSLNSGVVITCELLVTKVTQRWPARVVALIGFLLLGIGQALYSVPAGLVVFVGGTLIWTLAEITAGPTMSAYPANAGPERLRSQYLGASQSVFALGFAVGPIAGVLGWHLLGRQVWLWCGVAALVGLVAAWRGMQTAEHEDGAGLDTVPDAMSEAVLDDAALPDSAVQPDATGVPETAKSRFRLSRLRTPPAGAARRRACQAVNGAAIDRRPPECRKR